MNRASIFSTFNASNLRPYESFDEFLGRIFSFQRPEFYFGVERFISSNSVKAKVSECGNFRDFFGDTVVFNLDDSQKRFIQERYVQALYDSAPECLAEKLQESTLHVTLHDLNSSNHCDNDLLKKMFETEIVLSELIRQVNLKSKNITMVTTCVFNMVNTSLVLGLRPKTQEDYNSLMGLYSLIEGVHQLPYPLTPHITLAYYCHDGFEGKSLEVLQKTVNSLNLESFEITLSTDRLYYQKFISMNDYFNIMSFTRR